MKIKALSILVAILLCVSTVFVACGNKTNSLTAYKISDIMNPNWSMDAEGVIGSFKDASYVGDYCFAEYNFLVTEDASGDNRVVRVYNVTTDQAVTTLTDAKPTEASATATKNYVNIISSKYFAVLSVSAASDMSVAASTYFKCSLGSFEATDYTLTIYDASGNPVKSLYDNELSALCGGNIGNFDNAYASRGTDSTIIYEYQEIDAFVEEEILYDGDFDLFTMGSKIYRFNGKLEYELVKDYGLSSMPSLVNMQRVGDNYLETLGGVFAVYDKTLNKTFDYVVPAYAKTKAAFLLSNGNLLVQYSVQLDQNESSFDFRSDADGRYDLVTVLVTSEGASELDDVNYMIGSLKASVTDRNGKKTYADSVENLAFIFPIGENKMIDTSNANKKLVILKNDGELKGEVVVDKNIADYPANHTENYYSVRLIDGSCAIYDKQGEMVCKLSSDALDASIISDDYLLLTDAIYDAKGTKIYDLKEKYITVKFCGDTVILTTYGAASTTHSIFINGSLKSIGTISTNEKSSTIDGFGYGYGYYYTFSKEANKYTYYNTNGDVIGAFDKELNNCLNGDGFAIMQDTTNKIFYKFVFEK